jgi:hypothetical protein
MALGFKRFLLVVSAVIGLNATTASAEPRVYLTSQVKMIADGKEITCSWWNDRCEFGTFFDDSTDARAEYQKYQKIAYWTPYLRWGAIGLFVGYSIIKLSSDGTYDSGAALAFFIVPWVASQVVSFHATRHLLRAINIMNGVATDQASNSGPAFPPLANNRENRTDLVRTTLFQYSF